MRKVTIIVMLLMLLVSGVASAWQFQADEDKPKKRIIALMFVSNITQEKNKHWDKFNNYMQTKVQETTQNAVGTKYALSLDDTFAKNLKSMGFADPSLASTLELIASIPDPNINYLLYTEIAPLGGEQPILFLGGYMQVTMVVKILDLQNKKYLYAGKITKQSATDAWRAFDKCLPEYETILKNHIK